MTDDVLGCSGEHPLLILYMVQVLWLEQALIGSSSMQSETKGTHTAPSYVDWHCVAAALISRKTPNVLAAAFINNNNLQAFQLIVFARYLSLQPNIDNSRNKGTWHTAAFEATTSA